MTHNVSVAAFEAAADPDAYPDSGEPWQPLQLYYFVSFHAAKFVALHEEMLRRGLGKGARRRLARAGDHHPGAVRRLLRGQGPGPARARNPDRPGRLLVPLP